MTRIKICCIASPAEAAVALAAGADVLGLVATMPSGPGPISDDAIAEIAAGLPAHVLSLLLTAETTADAIADHVRRTGTRGVQIVSHIDPGEQARLARLLPDHERWQVVHVEDEGALAMIAAHAPHVTGFLLDSGRPSAGELGGTGRVHDWAISAAFVAASPVPVFLAGGLNPANAADAVRRVRPAGLDICSGLRRDARLDAELARRFVAAARQADG
ncbi:phosphoribosylanthranilate isomerase [Sandarakinorhabdus rubra]|uniref:phosphoribosylanthranilate isomerase n=1 Tax=Sandarakinorhabdus rubra TaxID=2672568 RepID=UPI0013DAF02C|nr:phosphoribosylanthranilate isomerase [Sandarakinorhabdus rubra]